MYRKLAPIAEPPTEESSLFRAGWMSRTDQNEDVAEQASAVIEWVASNRNATYPEFIEEDR